MKFLEYLRLMKEKITLIKPGQLVHLVIGNESCDLDSMVSSMVLAFHYTCLEKYQNTIVLPMMNKTEQLFPVKVENIYLLDKYNISMDFLIYRDTINLETMQQECKMTVSLIDHHVLPEDLKFLKRSVVEVIDHRPVDTTEEWSDNVHIDIQLVGSCCTLISSHINNHSVSQIALEMLYDVITYDTIGYREDAGKVKPMDLQVAEVLEKKLSIDPVVNRLQRFEDINDAHRNISMLTTEQLLYKDLKIVGKIYVPGLPMLAQRFIQRTDITEALAKFSRDNSAEVIIIMGLEVDDGHVCRDLALYTKMQEEAVTIESMLVTRFEVNKIPDKSTDDIKYYTQNNPKLSRKQLIPLLKSLDVEHV
ncbi:exopolyphosphatase PRUNE1 [Atheta coriaria]|uniref:exopolyphosphatase PRUNE1 n=1 Tax=Dalotia coriaria TaxID=877792 RepID=UPI0031F4795A